jgi:hypothetical protein
VSGVDASIIIKNLLITEMKAKIEQLEFKLWKAELENQVLRDQLAEVQDCE